MSPVAIITDLLIAGIAGTFGYFGARLGGELWARLILDSQQAIELRAKLKAIDSELHAIDAYEAAKRGKTSSGRRHRGRA